MPQLLMALLLSLWMALAPPAWGAGSVDLNTATSTELQSLPGIGPAKAAAIIQYRTDNGPFASVDQLTAVNGIGPATLANVRSMVTVDGSEAGAAPADASASSSSSAASSSAASSSSSSASSGGGIDINSASASALEGLPGIGPAKAAAIVADREANGPFSSCNALTRVHGIGAATVAKLASSCTAGGQ